MDKEVQNLIASLKYGKRNAQKSTVIGDRLKIKNFESTRGTTRNIIRRASNLYNIPIGSCLDGYFLIETQAELNSVLGRLSSRIKYMEERKSNLRNGFNNPAGHTPVTFKNRIAA